MHRHNLCATHTTTLDPRCIRIQTVYLCPFNQKLAHSANKHLGVPSLFDSHTHSELQMNHSRILIFIILYGYCSYSNETRVPSVWPYSSFNLNYKHLFNYQSTLNMMSSTSDIIFETSFNATIEIARLSLNSVYGINQTDICFKATIKQPSLTTGHSTASLQEVPFTSSVINDLRQYFVFW
jgi:hypothetical protein